MSEFDHQHHAEAAPGPLLRVRNLCVHFPLSHGFFRMKESKVLKAVDGVSFDLAPGEILGLVGESGCGKSSLGRGIIRLNVPITGKVEVNGADFLSMSGERLRKMRRKIQMIFQDPYDSLDPRMTVFDILAEPVRAHFRLSRGDLRNKISRVIDLVHLSSRALKKYPHEFSGGQRQRISVARALVLEPSIIIADEPTSALDVSVQAQVLNLLKEIQARLKLSMIFISHNLAVVEYLCERIAVMYLGKIVEMAGRDELYRSPRHPYTQALVSAVPIPDPKLERQRKHISIEGEIPSALNPPSGCAFHTRCPVAMKRCAQDTPQLLAVPQTTQRVSCFAVESGEV